MHDEWALTLMSCFTLSLCIILWNEANFIYNGAYMFKRERQFVSPYAALDDVWDSSSICNKSACIKEDYPNIKKGNDHFGTGYL